MALIPETGFGYTDANAGVSLAWADAFATLFALPNWPSAADDAAKEAAILAATQYVETRFGLSFAGEKKFTCEPYAKAVFRFIILPTGGDTITIDGTVVNVTVEDTMADCAETLAQSIYDETGYETLVIGASICVMAPMKGEEGNLIEVASSNVSNVWEYDNFRGGNFEDLSQALSFPRNYLYSREGKAINGIPEKYKQAIVMYADRALLAPLMPDPEVGSSGQIVQATAERLGPIEESVTYMKGYLFTQGTYPSVDGILKEFMATTSGGVYV